MTTAFSVRTSIATALSLIDQFIASIEASDSSCLQTKSPIPGHPSPSHLLTASVTSLKSTVTKISLLAITAPFAPSAVASTIQPLNTSILPSLITASLLTSPTSFPESFAQECATLTRVCLRDLRVLVSLIKKRADDGAPGQEVAEIVKNNITEATGKVWEDCDLLKSFADEWLAGFVCKKASEWLALMKDAVKELQEWDPAEEIDDDPFGLVEEHTDECPDDGALKETDKDKAAMSAGVKEQALKILSRIPQSIHVVIKQRLAKMPNENVSDHRATMVPIPAKRRKIVDEVLVKSRKISDCIDESAEGMYMSDLERCLKKAGEARALTIEVVEAVLHPWEVSDAETREDLYIRRALTWIQQVQPDSVNGLS